jgi:hypothetical protein
MSEPIRLFDTIAKYKGTAGVPVHTEEGHIPVDGPGHFRPVATLSLQTCCEQTVLKSSNCVKLQHRFPGRNLWLGIELTAVPRRSDRC